MSKLQKSEGFLLFLAVFFLPTQLGKHFWPDFSFVYSLPVDYLSPTLYFWDLLVILLCLIFIFKKEQVNKLALNLFLFFILTESFSLIANPTSLGVGLIRIEQYFIAGLFGIYIASTGKNNLKPAIFWGFISTVLFEGILATTQFLKGGTLGLWLFGERTFSISTPGISKFDYYGREFLRPYATFPHPNVLSAFMMLGIVILNSAKDLGLLPEGKRVKQMVITANLLAASTILFTVSRVAIVCGLVYATTISIKNRHKILLVILAVMLLPVLYTRFSSLLNFDNLTFVRREELSQIALSLFKTSPIFGVGLNNFIPAASDLLLSGPNRFLQPVHDIFLLSLSETGLVGFGGLLVLIGYPLFRLFKLRPKPLPAGRQAYALYPILTLWVIIAFLGLFDHYFLTLPQGYRLLFFVWGLSIRMLE